MSRASRAVQVHAAAAEAVKVYDKEYSLGGKKLKVSTAVSDKDRFLCTGGAASPLQLWPLYELRSCMTLHCFA